MSNDTNFFEYSRNRLMLVDWSSLSYHQWWSMNSEKNRDKYGLQNSEGELRIWKNKMIVAMLDLIEMFNPKDIVLAIDGKSWRKEYVKAYYDENAMVYYDDKNIYTEADNFAYKISKVGEGLYDAIRIKVADYGIFRNLEKKVKLGDLSPVKNKMIWDIMCDGKTPIIPSYKGKRKAGDWPFNTDKNEWQGLKDEFGLNVAKYFRALAIKIDGAEGDDVLYSAVQNLSDKYDSIVMVTRDSDMLQIDNPKVTFYDHVNDEFSVCKDPKGYLLTKILSGDKSDNISGMSLPDKKKPGLPKANQLGEAGAANLLKETADLCEQAKSEGWYNQYIRNTNLIDLSYTPKEIQNEIAKHFNFESVELVDFGGLSALGINDRILQSGTHYKDRKFYSLQPRLEVINHPEMFDNEIKEQKRRIENANEEIVSIPGASDNNVNEFGNIGVFKTPFDDIGDMF